MNNMNISWAAGFLEGEGSFGYWGTTPKVVCPQMQREPLERLQRIFGGTIGIRGRQHPISYWWANGTLAISIMMTVYSLMSPKRKKQIEKAIAVWKTKPGYGARRKGYKWVDGAWQKS
jgi:hypothetical protein